MTEDRLPLAELLAKAGDGDFLRSVAETLVQLLMETDVEGLIGARRHERTAERATYRRYHVVPSGPSAVRKCQSSAENLTQKLTSVPIA